jgi:hypothetical protein
MSRGAVFFIIQLLVGFAIAAMGIWALSRPKHFQGFVHENFALLPEVRPQSIVTPTLLRIIGVALIAYGCMLLSNFRDELIWLGKLFRVISN